LGRIPPKEGGKFGIITEIWDIHENKNSHLYKTSIISFIGQRTYYHWYWDIYLKMLALAVVKCRMKNDLAVTD